MQKPAPTTSKWGLGREAWAALLRVRTRPECPEGNLSMSWRPWSLGVRCGVTVEAVGCRALSRERVWGLPSPHQLGDFASLTGITGLGGLCGEQGWMGDDEQLG